MEDWSWIKRLPVGSPERIEAEQLAGEVIALQESNPLQFFRPHGDQQREFMAALTAIVAAFAGNRFGKTTALVVKALIECVPAEFLPPRLLAFKRWPGPSFGRIVCPDFTATAEGVILPAFRKWGPKEAWRGGSFDKAWDKQLRTLRFANGSWIQVMTYEQDLDKFGGAALHFVGYDEPPPKQIRDECQMRLIDFGGYEMFAMTPLKANTGWIRRDVWKKREQPDITVVKGSIHDNPTLDEKAKERVLSGFTDLWRRAREFGDFVDVGGLIYPDFERRVLEESHPHIVKRGGELMMDPEFVRSLDHVTGIDPGIRNAGFSFTGFDSENVEWVYDEGLLQDKTPRDYADFMRATHERWGIKTADVHYVADPAARQRGQTNAETVLSALQQLEVYANAGQNDIDAGIGQIRTRMAHGRYWVGPNCRWMRDQADDYAAEEPGENRDDSQLKPIKGNDHILDANRYASMERFWDPVMEQHAPDRNLGWQPGQALPAELMQPRQPVGPMGSMG